MRIDPSEYEYIKKAFRIDYNKELDEMVESFGRFVKHTNTNPKYENAHINKFQKGKQR